MKSWKRALRTAGIAVGGAIVILILFTVFFETRLIYFPTKYPNGLWKEAERSTLPVEEVSVTAEDGVKTVGWFAHVPNPGWTILWFHGNAGNITDRFDQLVAMAERLGVDILIMDYRGYGKSEGSPSEKGIDLDADAAWRYLTAQRGIAPERLLIWGKSLGGGAATTLASRRPCGGLILQSTYTSLGDMSKLVLPLFPARWFMRNKFDNLAKIGSIAAPKLFLHSRKDSIIPFEMGERLFAAAKEPKSSVWFERIDHNDQFYGNREEYLRAWSGWLDTLR